MTIVDLLKQIGDLPAWYLLVIWIFYPFVSAFVSAFTVVFESMFRDVFKLGKSVTDKNTSIEPNASPTQPNSRHPFDTLGHDWDASDWKDKRDG